MGCGSCSSGGNKPGGCNSSGGCATGGCNKLNTYDWFSEVAMPGEPESEHIYEIRFKNTRKLFARNTNKVSLVTGDMVVVSSDRGYDVGQISLSGVLAKLQMKKRRVKENSDKIMKIFRRATAEDLEKLAKARDREQKALVRVRQIVKELRLEMKMSDIEFQGDNNKAIFYYIADQRVDFRTLIKVLADEFHVRVEMKQIGLRHEAGLVGGIGSCGRELCCSTWLTDFKTVPTSAARYQNLSLNPMKISGQCGRLKCCLNYELETYLDALEDIPKITKIETEVGVAYLQKTDIFKRIMWFSYQNESTWVALDVEKVVAMDKLTRSGKKLASLHVLDDAEEIRSKKENDFVDVVGQASLRPEREKSRSKSRNKGRGRGNENRNSPRNQSRENPNQKKSENKPSGENKNQGPKSEGEKTENRNNRGSGNRNKGRNRGNNRNKGRGSKNRPGNKNPGNNNPGNPPE